MVVEIFLRNPLIITRSEFASIAILPGDKGIGLFAFRQPLLGARQGQLLCGCCHQTFRKAHPLKAGEPQSGLHMFGRTVDPRPDDILKGGGPQAFRPFAGQRIVRVPVDEELLPFAHVVQDIVEAQRVAFGLVDDHLALFGQQPRKRCTHDCVKFCDRLKPDLLQLDLRVHENVPDRAAAVGRPVDWCGRVPFRLPARHDQQQWPAMLACQCQQIAHQFAQTEIAGDPLGVINHQHQRNRLQRFRRRVADRIEVRKNGLGDVVALFRQSLVRG